MLPLFRPGSPPGNDEHLRKWESLPLINRNLVHVIMPAKFLDIPLRVTRENSRID
jgi:hypothetical protein